MLGRRLRAGRRQLPLADLDAALRRSPVASALVDVVVQLGRRLGLRVIAEGVSADAERTVVEAAGCRLGQGDLFGPAMPAEMIDKLLASGGHVTIPRPRNPALSTPPSDTVRP
jgi:predicted signal transduction protein with EAL and GGDEF domain